jgi:hypothetical protein
VGTSQKSANLQMFVTMQRLVERISMATRERNNGKKLRFLYGPPLLCKEDTA